MATYAGRYSEDLQDRYGNGYRNALVAVETTAGDPITLYADRDKTAYVPASGLAANEIKADSRGNLIFFADPGNYQIVVTPVGGSTLAAFPVSVLPDPLEPDLSEGALQADANLSDLASAPTARDNLGLGDAATQDAADLPVSTDQAAALALKAADVDVLHKATDETVTGVKDFQEPFRVGRFTMAALLAKTAAEGALARVTDSIRGLWIRTSSRWISLTNGRVYLSEFATPDGTDQRTGILAAIAAAQANGGGTVEVGPGIWGWTGYIEVPSGVDLWGLGGNKNAPATTFKALDAAAQISYGTTGADSRSGISGNFLIDANNVATQPLRFGRRVQTSFDPIYVKNAAAGRAAVVIEEGQNCYWRELAIADSAGPGLLFDRGTGGHLIDILEINNCGSSGTYQLVFTQSTPSGGILYSVPSHIRILHAIVERPASGALGGVLHSAGLENFLDGFISAFATTDPLIHIKMEYGGTYVSSNLRVRAATFTNATHVGTVFDIGSGCTLICEDHPYVVAAQYLYKLGASGTVETPGPTLNSNFNTELDPSSSGSVGTLVRTRLRHPLQSNRRTLADSTLVAQVDGEAGMRYIDRVDGRRTYGDGTDFVGDVSWYRFAAGVLRTSGKIQQDTAPSGATDLIRKQELDAEAAALTAALADKADLVSGTVPDAQIPPSIARDDEVAAAVAALVDSSPDALNTLNELAAALGDDPNFATTVTNALAGKEAVGVAAAGDASLDARITPLEADTGWQLPTLATDITVNATWAHLGYRKKDGIVHFNLGLNVANAAVDKLLFTIPVGYRPAGPTKRTVLVGVSNQIRIDPTNGEVRTNVAGGNVFLVGSYPADS